MEDTHIVSNIDLETYATSRDSEAVIPELIWILVNRSVSDLTTCRIPYGDSIGQSGWDGIVETESGFRQFVPSKRSFWEIEHHVQEFQSWMERSQTLNLPSVVAVPGGLCSQ
jgi:hypothetical protein